jgi:hypothetical protein
MKNSTIKATNKDADVTWNSCGEAILYEVLYKVQYMILTEPKKYPVWKFGGAYHIVMIWIEEGKRAAKEAYDSLTIFDKKSDILEFWEKMDDLLYPLYLH